MSNSYDKESNEVSKLVGLYIKAKDDLAEHARVFKEFKAKRDAQIGNILDRLGVITRELGVDSLKCKEGTAYEAEEEFINVEDWEMFRTFVVSNDLVHMFVKKAAKTAVLEYKKQNNQIPPGLKYISKKGMRVRRS